MWSLEKGKPLCNRQGKTKRPAEPNSDVPELLDPCLLLPTYGVFCYVRNVVMPLLIVVSLTWDIQMATFVFYIIAF